MTDLKEQPSDEVPNGAMDSVPGDGFVYYYAIRANNDSNDTLYVVDEASMVSDKETKGEFIRFGSGRLLKDLLDYAGCTDPGVSRKIIFVGDPMQLPPVGSKDSPALDTAYLAAEHAVQTSSWALTDVVRQEGGSTILNLANNIRMWITSGKLRQFQVPPDAHDLKRLDVGAIAAEFVARFRRDGDSSTMLVAYTNGTVAGLNLSVREMLFPGHDDPCNDDRLVVMRNSYRTGLLNGDLVHIAGILGGPITRSLTLSDKDGDKLVTLVFQAVLIRRELEEGADDVDCLILRSLLDKKELLSSEEQRALYVDFKIRHPGLKPGTQAFKEELGDDLYFNALHVKYGYAVTCHKAQGGEWPTVIVDFDGRAPNGNAEFLRWAYTAVTRAKRELLVAREPHSRLLPDIQTQAAISPRGIEDRVSTAAGQLRADGFEVEFKYHQYRVRWEIRREGSVAKLDTTYDDDGDFNPPCPVGKSVSPDFDKVVGKRLTELLAAAVLAPTESPPFTPDDGKPFLTELFKKVTAAVGDLPVAVRVTRLEWRERYRFTADHRWTEVDFNYKATGKITRLTVSQAPGADRELGEQIKVRLDRL